ncbi:posphoenolpyruvate synthetase regulatory kinase/phosphorylase PpsR [Aestuariirhabdus litorea]|uniref:Putative phosphoenolpyruvate synthase regulatory protein n=1 Tax=Aestuariirhabdus litorea TaxID=2528527 RepID=A0A3P3VQ37_9GAMM|nr:pyruvate, water dikinase regulatory protein [Aestuariirhabdus litorea]RRJ84845.1 kinase/pyrophosphorylase [Aestuariirhabdus litorea]RWW98072.1 pyruvate, phosphate dikinase/phosphoenolpyruvate synthase regulator [Endozoicomonadaceae bacterium GTF-13]
MKRYVFFISDGTGITAESFGQSLLAQFDHVEFDRQTLPYIDTPAKAEQVVARINSCAAQQGIPPLVFSTIVDEAIAAIVSKANARQQDIFATFLAPLEQELQLHSSHAIGKKRKIDENTHYSERIDAVHFALDNDDGARTRHYDKADIILIGVSRCGKTPTCLYLALQFGIRAANYPITEEDMEDFRLPAPLHPYRHKLFGLTIEPQRLVAIRSERRPNSRYASPRQCQMEIAEVARLLEKERIPCIDTTHFSVEEIATRIIADAGIARRLK